MLEQIKQTIVDNFDFTYIILTNVITYIAIKVIEYFRKYKLTNKLIKRIVLIGAILLLGTIYIFAGYEHKIKLINSAIAAPVFWSWVIKPFLKKIGFDYKKIEDTIE